MLDETMNVVEAREGSEPVPMPAHVVYAAMEPASKDSAIHALARSIHEGAWTVMSGGWRYDDATVDERRLARRQARATMEVAAAHAGEALRGALVSMLARESGRPEAEALMFAEAKADRVMIWLRFLERGIIL